MSLLSQSLAIPLKPVVEKLVQEHLGGILIFRSFTLNGKKPQLTFGLEGFPPEQEFTVEIGRLAIAEDGHSVRLGGYTSNALFLENALNRFATRTIPIESDAVAFTLRNARKFLV